MQTIPEQRRMDIQSTGFLPSYSQTPSSENQVNRLKISEFKSWLACFAIVAFLTGLLKFLKVGVTVEPITSMFFYISLLAVAYFLYRIVSLSRNPVQVKTGSLHELN